MQNASDKTTTQRVSISTIAELVFTATPAMNFSRLVSDLDNVLLRFHPDQRTLLWDCDDVAIFDVPGTRIALAYSGEPRQGIAASLLICVGPSPLKPPVDKEQALFARGPVRHQILCSRLVERVQARLAPDAIYWQEVSVPVTADLIDSFTDPTHNPHRDAVSAWQPAAETAPGFEAAFAHAKAPSAEFGSNALSSHNPELLHLRQALYPELADLPRRLTSNQMRLATHAMNATLIAASLPIGAALTTYAVLRGENMRTTTSAMVLTGLAGSLAPAKLADQLMYLGFI